MGGEIWVESDPAQGSRFHFTAGFELGSPDAPVLDAPHSALARATVLVVDDNATSRRVLGEILTGWQMLTLPAADSAEVMAALAAGKQDGFPVRFVLLDSQLEGADTSILVREIRRRTLPAPVVILMQPVASGPAETERFRAAGVGAFLVKPIGPSELLAALLYCSEAGERAPEPLPVSNLSPRRLTPSLHVLLAEDNAVNRELATTVLRKLGHSVTTVSNGQQALAAWERGSFDLVLMDVQMPAMDGMEATTLIREQEKDTGRHTPIFGLTAHAMMGDREQGLAAGMDEYITKPLRLESLIEAIQRWATPVGPSSGEPPIRFQPERLLRSLGGDEVALRRLVRIYLDTTPPLLAKLDSSLEQKDTAAFLHAAHTLKGSLQQLEATEAAAIAAELEAQARTGDLAATEPRLAELHRRVESLQRAAQRWLEPAHAGVHSSHA
jgi:CheY-like chemotaxis protein/HPt (histidine-containing phosphotransfer) domain-containing protein